MLRFIGTRALGPTALGSHACKQATPLTEVLYLYNIYNTASILVHMYVYTLKAKYRHFKDTVHEGHRRHTSTLNMRAHTGSLLTLTQFLKASAGSSIEPFAMMTPGLSSSLICLSNWTSCSELQYTHITIIIYIFIIAELIRLHKTSSTMLVIAHTNCFKSKHFLRTSY